MNEGGRKTRCIPLPGEKRSEEKRRGKANEGEKEKRKKKQRVGKRERESFGNQEVFFEGFFVFPAEPML